MEIIEHSGVKGQKWGVRRDLTKKEKSARVERQNFSDRRRQLSDKDLNAIIERLSNERKLKTLVEEDLSPGKAATKRILSTSGQKVASSVVTGATMYAIKAGMTKKFDAQDAAGYLVPKPKK